MDHERAVRRHDGGVRYAGARMRGLAVRGLGRPETRRVDYPEGRRKKEGRPCVRKPGGWITRKGRKKEGRPCVRWPSGLGVGIYSGGSTRCLLRPPRISFDSCQRRHLPLLELPLLQRSPAHSPSSLAPGLCSAASDLLLLLLLRPRPEASTKVDAPSGMGNNGNHHYTMCRTMFEIDTKYVPTKLIGKGAYGTVCSSINQETNEKVAIKKINNVFDNRVDALRMLRELKLLRHLRHENVICVKDIMMPVRRRSFKDVYLVSELMDTDLHQIIYSPQLLSNDHCQYFLFQLLRGLKCLHSAGIIHRDLKPLNLLVNANSDLKICDFGLARTNNTQGQFMTEYVVTRPYRAPELLLGSDNYGTSIDVWSVGCIFAELLGRKPIFPGTGCLNQLKLIVNVLGTMNDGDPKFIDKSRARKYIKSLPYSPGIPLSSMYPQAHPLAIDLLQKMLVFDPSKRISVVEALEHPYMSALYDPSANLPAQVPIDLDIDENLGVDMIREMVWQEMLQYHRRPSKWRIFNK